MTIVKPGDVVLWDNGISFEIGVVQQIRTWDLVVEQEGKTALFDRHDIYLFTKEKYNELTKKYEHSAEN